MKVPVTGSYSSAVAGSYGGTALLARNPLVTRTRPSSSGTGKERGAILNDLDAIEAGLGEGNGLGFIVLTGDPDYSGGLEFHAWHRGLRGAGPAHERSRALKSGFGPVRLDAFHLPDASALDLARGQGAYAVMQQGRQPDGAARKPKLKINFAAAMKPLGSLVASRDLAGR